jgi:predicted RNA-binding Zn-ribbon protein involved in translation (DUF1610 family)
MTVEHKVVVGLDDIKAIVFECLKCGAKVTRSPDSGREVPYTCSECRISWRDNDTKGDVEHWQDCFSKFTKSIGDIRTLDKQRQGNFRILFEFEAPASK